MEAAKTITDRAHLGLHGFLDPTDSRTNRDVRGWDHFTMPAEALKIKLVALGSQRQGRVISVSLFAT